MEEGMEAALQQLSKVELQALAIQQGLKQVRVKSGQEPCWQPGIHH
jgi:hypothetical protein